MTDLPLVYIAGPYSRPDPEENTERILVLAMRLYEQGRIVPLVPHLTHFWNLAIPRPTTFWYEYDFHLLRRCDAVLRVSGESFGADGETHLARELGLPVFEDADELAEWAESWAIREG